MTTGHKIADGTDLDALFTAGNAGYTTGFKNAAGTDLGSLFHPYTTGAKRGTTNFRNAASTDFADLFQNSSVPLFSFTAVNEYVEDYGVYDPPWSEYYGAPGIQYNTDGTTTCLAPISGGYAGTAWATGGGYTSKYVRLASYSGTAPTGPSGWQPLSSARSWQIVGNPTAYSELTIQFSHDGVNSAHQVVVTLNAVLN
jgi:hypothetical protein